MGVVELGPGPRSLEEIGSEKVVAAATEIIGFEIASVGEPEWEGGWPTIELDPGIDANWEYELGQRATEVAASAFWASDAPGTPDGVIDGVKEDLCERIAAGAEYWRSDTVEKLARGLVGRFPGLIGPDSPYHEPSHLVAELEERLGMYVDVSAVDRVIESCTSRTTLVIGTASDFEADWGPSRRVLRSAAEWLDGPRAGAWDPTTDPGLSKDYATCSAQWLCRAQGTTLIDVVNGYGGDFAESLREAITEDVGSYSWGWPMIGVMTTMSLEDLAIANTAREWNTARGMDMPFATVPTGITPQGLSRQPNIVLFDPVNGNGQCVPIELDDPIEVKYGNVCCAMRDGVGGKWGNWYTSQEIGGWLPSEFERKLRRPVSANEIDKEPMIGKPMGTKLR